MTRQKLHLNDSKIYALVDQAVESSDDGNFSQAAKLYQKAIELLPEPKRDYTIYIGLVAALVESLVNAKEYGNAIVAAKLSGYEVDKPISDMPLFHFYWGKALFETGDIKGASEQLSIAFISEFLESGECIYTSNLLLSEEDPKYFELVKKTIQPPEEWGSWDVVAQPPSFLQKVLKWFAN